MSLTNVRGRFLPEAAGRKLAIGWLLWPTSRHSACRIDQSSTNAIHPDQQQFARFFNRYGSSLEESFLRRARRVLSYRGGLVFGLFLTSTATGHFPQGLASVFRVFEADQYRRLKTPFAKFGQRDSLPSLRNRQRRSSPSWAGKLVGEAGCFAIAGSGRLLRGGDCHDPCATLDASLSLARRLPVRPPRARRRAGGRGRLSGVRLLGRSSMLRVGGNNADRPVDPARRPE